MYLPSFIYSFFSAGAASFVGAAASAAGAAASAAGAVASAAGDVASALSESNPEGAAELTAAVAQSNPAAAEAVAGAVAEAAPEQAAAAAKAMAAGNRAGYEISKAHAMRWITSNPANAAGILDQTGSIEVGKDADVVLWPGDPFSIYSRAETVMIA